MLELRRIPVSQIAQTRVYRSWETTTRYGSGNMGGVIAINTELPSAVEAAQKR